MKELIKLTKWILLFVFLVMILMSIHVGASNREKGDTYGKLMGNIINDQYEMTNENTNNIIEYIMVDFLFFIAALGIAIAYFIPFPFEVWRIINIIATVIIILATIVLLINVFKSILKKKKQGDKNDKIN